MNRKRILLLLVVIGLVAAAAAYSMGWFHRDTHSAGLRHRRSAQHPRRL